MSFHLYTINELYSNADGSNQFIEMTVGSENGEGFWAGRTISVTQGGTTHSFTFPADLPSETTANTKVLIATQGFANLGISSPDFIIPAGFLFINGGTVNYAGVDSFTYAALPTDGTSSLGRSGSASPASPTDFAGTAGTLSPSGGSSGVQQGGSGNDSFQSRPGNEMIDGGSGFDTVTYNGNRANYAISKVGSTVTVQSADGADTLTHIEYLQFADQPVAIAPSNTSNQYAALLYQGGLGRTPDPTGLDYWVNLAENLPPATKAMGLYGLSDASGNYNGNLSIAGGFTQSAEFIGKYGSLTDEQFVTQLYANVLDRGPDPNGFNDWKSQLSRGATREHVLIGFAESAEAISNATVGFVGIHGQHAAWLVLT